MTILYPWILAAHIFSAFAWMAGLWYLPRLFVYHRTAQEEKEREKQGVQADHAHTIATLEVMEYRLMRAIMNPAMIGVWLLGLTLLWLNPSLLAQPWLHTKITLVVILTVFHMVLARWRRLLAAGSAHHSARFYRWMNEVPTLLLIGILIAVIVRPG